MPEPGSEADEAVRDARQVVYRVDQGRQLASQQVTLMSDDLNLEAALDAYEAAIRASERAKVEALLEAARVVYPVVLDWAGAEASTAFHDALEAYREGAK